MLSDGWAVIKEAVSLSLKQTRDSLETANGKRFFQAQGAARAYRHVLDMPETLKVLNQ